MDTAMCIADHLDRHLDRDVIAKRRRRREREASLPAARAKVEALLAESAVVPERSYPTSVTFNRTLCSPECDSFAVDMVSGDARPVFVEYGYDIPDGLAENLLDILEEMVRAGNVKWDHSHRATSTWTLDLHVEREAVRAAREREDALSGFRNYLFDLIEGHGGTADSATVEWDAFGAAFVVAAFNGERAAEIDGLDMNDLVRIHNASYSTRCTSEDIGATRVGDEWRITPTPAE